MFQLQYISHNLYGKDSDIKYSTYIYLNGAWVGQTWSVQKNENLDLIITL